MHEIHPGEQAQIPPADKRSNPGQGAAPRADPPRRASGSYAVAKLLRRLLDPAARARGFAEAAILDQWPTIVGETLGRHSQPSAVHFPGPRRGGGILVLKCGSATALQLQHSAPQLIERINRFFGYPAIRSIRLLPTHGFRGFAPAAPPPARVASAEAMALVEATLEGVADRELRGALGNLGRAIHARPAESTQPAARGLARSLERA
jgi:hypothetical protein